MIIGDGMKKILFLLLFFIGIGIVKADEWPALESFKIKNVDYDLHFNANKYDYYLPVPLEVDKLDIEYTTNCSCEVRINGNENFKNGVNKVVITLLDKENEQAVKYTITVDKRYMAKEEEKKEEEKKEVFPITYVGLGFAIAAIVIGIIAVIKSKKTSK